MFSDLSDRRPQLFGERPQSEALFDMRALQRPRPRPQLVRSSPRHSGSGLIDLFALTGTTGWNRDAATHGTLVHEVGCSATPTPPEPTPQSRPVRLRRWLLPGVTAVCTTAGLFALML